jgi:hypothetical protein
MSNPVDFVNVSTSGLEASDWAQALAGLRANEARYFKNKYDLVFETTPAAEAPELVDYVSKVLLERNLVFSSQPLEVTDMMIETADGLTRWTYVFYESGLAVNVLYTVNDNTKRAVGFKLSDGLEVPEELDGRFTFARMKSKLAGTIRGSYFVVKGEY